MRKQIEIAIVSQISAHRELEREEKQIEIAKVSQISAHRELEREKGR